MAITGVITGDSTSIPKRSILTFGKGPSLQDQGISSYLANPYLTLKDFEGTTIGTNDSWVNMNAPGDELTDADLAPTSSAEAGMWPILDAGTYTAILRGANGGTGVGLIEMYEY